MKEKSAEFQKLTSAAKVNSFSIFTKPRAEGNTYTLIKILPKH
jgi:hypothetical protein